jgi:O-antigen/teichoic acid export membrane protein
LTNATSSVVTRILQITVFVWVNQHLLKRIAPEEYSLLPLVLSLMLFAEIFKNLLTGGLGRFLVEADSRGDDLGVTRIVSSIFPFVAMASCLFAIAGLLATRQLDQLVNVAPGYLAQARIMLALAIFSLCLSVLASPFVDGAYVRQRFVALNAIALTCEAFRITLLLILLFGVSTKVMWLVVASTCATILNLSLRVILTRRLVPAIRFRLGLFCRQTVGKLLRFGGWTSIQGITGLVSSTAPILLLNRFGSPLDVSAFYLGRLPDSHIRGLASMASTPAQPALTSIYATQGAGALHDLYYRGGRYHLWLALMVGAPLLIFAQEIITLYAGAQYSPAATVMFAMLAVYPCLWASAMLFHIAHAIGKIGAYYVCDIVIQVLTLLAMFFAVGHLGLAAPGAAIAMALVSGLLHVVLVWPMGLRLVKGRWDLFIRQTLLPGLLPFAAALVACGVFNASVDLNSWTLIGLGSALALAVYVAVLLRFCLDSTDHDLVNRLVGKMKGASTVSG